MALRGVDGCVWRGCMPVQEWLFFFEVQLLAGKHAHLSSNAGSQAACFRVQDHLELQESTPRQPFP